MKKLIFLPTPAAYALMSYGVCDSPIIGSFETKAPNTVAVDTVIKMAANPQSGIRMANGLFPMYTS